jgi:Colicin immunity protein / pyocin immunity protein
MNTERLSRDQLIKLVGNIRAAQDHGRPHDELLALLESSVTCPDAANLCQSDYPDETVVDICLGWEKTQRKLTREELLELVRRIFGPTETEAEKILMVAAFDYNCRHPSKNGLLFYPEDAFNGRRDPTPEEIVDKAIRGE